MRCMLVVSHSNLLLTLGRFAQHESYPLEDEELVRRVSERFSINFDLGKL